MILAPHEENHSYTPGCYYRRVATTGGLLLQSVREGVVVQGDLNSSKAVIL